MAVVRLRMGRSGGCWRLDTRFISYGPDLDQDQEQEQEQEVHQGTLFMSYVRCAIWTPSLTALARAEVDEVMRFLSI